MADINRVILVGRLTRDAELRYTNNGLPVSKFGLAINKRRKKDDQWIDEAHFFNIVLWGKTAESLQPYLVKGKQIGVEGELRQNRWEQDGQSRSTVEIAATNVQLLGGRQSGQGQGQQGGYQSQGGNQPHGGYQSQGGNQSQNYPPQNNPPVDSNQGRPPIDDFEDDIPF